jgi:hypothetical protein
MSAASGHHGPVDIDDDISDLTAWLFWASALALTFVACARFCKGAVAKQKRTAAALGGGA